ncbi:MAG: gliding motility-associated C-terminal domain-containing protein [Saprospiraceae bacterium]|nr:gliding motility-associated C-terminal domain-containing protein [Saprospiraceae bacterium]
MSCYQGATTNSTPVSMPPYWCTSVENNQWFAFTANGPNASFQIEALNCNSGGAIQAALLQTGDCVNFDFVSDCIGDIPENSTVTLSNNVPLIPGAVYYLMIDGSAGANCNYAINGSSAITTGPTNDCIPSQAPSNYVSTSASDWTIFPASAGQFVGGSSGTSVFVEWLQAGVFQICAQNINCPNVPPFCLDVTIGESVEATYEVNLCQGESVYCGGTTYSSAGTYVNAVPAPSGCDSIITCIVTDIPPVSSPMQFVNLCGPAEFQLCNDFWAFSGVYTSICDNWQGCDSAASVTLNILEPVASISEPAVIGCGVDSLVFLDGSGSGLAFPPNTWKMQWTGPGIVGPSNQILCQVSEPGEYCLTVTHTVPGGGFSCENTMCVNVIEDVQYPSPPQVTGPLTVCQNAQSTYTANLQGAVIPDDLVWTTPHGEPVVEGPNNTAIVTWTQPTGGLLCVTANNECGASAPACITVTVNAGPVTPIITGPTTVCANNTAQTFTITNAAAGVNYSWTVPTGATFTGSGSSINVNFSGVANGNVSVCATASNNCGTSQQACANVAVTGPPTTPIMSGPTSVCANGTPASFSVTNIQAGVDYTWTAPPGAVISGSGSSVTIDFANSNASGQVCVTATNSCGNPSVCQAITVAPPPTVTISGTGEFCQGTTPNLSLNLDLTGQQPWVVTYTINGGAPITVTVPSSPFSLPVSVAGTYTLVSVSGANQCTNTATGSATIVENPSPTASLTGGGTICEGSGETIPLSIVLTGEAPWSVQWSINGNAQSPLSINSSPFSLPIGEALAGTITLGAVADNNGCNGNGTGTSTVTVFGAPEVSNVVVECNATNTSYTVSFDITGGDAGSYSVLPAGNLASGHFVSNPIPTGAGYSFVATDANFCNPINVADPIVVCDCDTKVGVMELNLLSECGPGTISPFYDGANEFLDGNDIRVFVLHSGNSVSIEPPIIGVFDNTDITFNAASMNYGQTYYLSAMVGDDNGNGNVLATDPCAQIAQGTPIVFYEVPSASIAGGNEVCVGNSLDLTLQLSGASPWEVTINGQSVSIFTSPFTYTVTPNSTTNFVLSNVMDAHCSATLNDSETVTVNEPPTVGTPVVQCDPTGTSFTVCFEIFGGDASCYSVLPMNGTLTGNMFCSNPIPDGQGYHYTISDCKGCTPVIIDKPLVDCSCLSTAGSLSTTKTDYCGAEVAVAVYEDNNEFLDADDGRCFLLHAGNPLNPIATNSIPEFGFIPASMTYGQSYFICPAVANDDGNGCVDLSDPCLSIGGCVEIAFHEIPTASIGQDASICLGDEAVLTFNATGVGPWEVSYEDAQGNPFNMTLTTSPVDFNVDPTSDNSYSLIGVTDAFCTGTVSGIANVNVNEAPEILNILETCSPDATGYTVTFDIVGGDPGTTTVTPSTGFFTNGTFTSQQFSNNTPWSFSVDDNNGCGPTTASGNQNCNCITDAGAMNTNGVQSACENEQVTVGESTGFVLDPDDVLVYYLHTGSGPSLGTVLGTTTTVPPSFGFNTTTMTFGTTYYISAVAANDNGSGGIDLSDGCLDVAPGTPVVFHELPTAAISGTTAICQGMSTPVTFSATGEGPFTISYSVNGGAAQTVQVPVSGTFTQDFTPNATTTISLISVEDSNCSDAATGSITLTVNPNVNAGDVTGNFEFCKGESQVIDLNTKLENATAGGTWLTPGGEILPNGNLNIAGLSPGTHDFTYSVPGLPPCPNDEAIVQVVIHPNPVADAGEPAQLTCEIRELTIGGPGTSPGMTYAWTGNVSSTTIANPKVTEPGTYMLTVTSSEGCTATDEVTITQDIAPPTADIFVSDVSCFGENDGFITISNIQGGTPPYLCSFNDGPLTDKKTFDHLGPGDKKIVIVDAFGCETTLNFMVNEPVEVTVDIDGNFEGDLPLVELGDPLVISIQTTPPANELDSISWYPAELVDCDSCDQNTVYLTQQTTFKVVVDKGGCKDEDVITVFVHKDHPIYVPNAFSPNGDLTNDKLMIFAGKEVKQIKSFLIFSRWGETVFEYYRFEPNNPDFGWDGKHRGEVLNTAVFTWYAEVEFIDGVVKLFEGDVTLMR